MQIVITLTDSDKPELIAAVLSALQGQPVETVKTEPEKPAKIRKAAEPKIEEPKQKESQPELKQEPKQEKPAEITIVQIRAKVAELIQHATNGKENKTQMKEWVTGYGATGVETIPVEKYDDFMDKLKTL